MTPSQREHKLQLVLITLGAAKSRLETTMRYIAEVEQFIQDEVTEEKLACALAEKLDEALTPKEGTHGEQ
jgi:hypothetical protein